MNFYKNIIYILFIFLSFELSAQDFFFDTEVINVEQGLPSRRTYNIVQDLDGFIWVSTVGKISRYDGYNFKSYTADLLNINESLPTFLAIDDAGLLWYCEYPSYSSTNETGVINTKTNEIQSIESFSNGLIKNNTVSKISASDATSALLIETQNGTIYSYETGKFSVIFKFSIPYPAKSPCVLKEYEKGVYWIGKESSLYKVRKQKIIERYNVPRYIIDIQVFRNTFVIKTLLNMERKLWKLENKKAVPFSTDDLTEPNLAHIQNTFNDYYFLCNNKIIIKNKENQIIYEYNGFKELAKSRDNYLKVQEVFIDRQNIHWITTENGLIKVTVRKNNFQILEKNNSTRGIYKSHGNLWVGGYFNNLFGEKNADLLNIIPKINVALGGFSEDDSGNLWIGTTSNFLLKYNHEKQKSEKFIKKENTLYLPYYNRDLKKVFIGQENGVSVFDPKTEQFLSKKLPINSDAVEVRQFLENGNDVWIVSSKGLFVMKKESGEIYDFFNKEDGFLSDNFNHLYIDKAGVFWLATRENGLIRWSRRNDDRKVFSRENGLSNNTIYAVYEDDFNNLWLPTNYGLNRLDKISFETSIFLPKDGVAHEEFNTISHFKDENGWLYFGGLSGVTIFHPKDFNTFKYRPTLEIINIEKSGKDDLFSQKILEKYKREKVINLNYDDQNLTLELALLDFMNPKENQYIYRLNGANNKWVYTKNNFLSFDRLPPGKYSLSLKAKGALGNYSDEMLSVQIVVKPPFYKESWFMILSFLSSAILVYLLFKWRLKRLKNDRIRLETEVTKRTETILKQTEELKALDKAKTQFFSNITHEFRTPLTLIIGPLEQLLSEKMKEKTQNKLKGIHRNANLLKDLINQLLDLSKIESGKMQIEITHGDLINYTKELTANFQLLAEQKSQKLQFRSDLELWETHFDKEKWHKIIFNLLSNAIKFTPKNGSITVELLKLIKAGKESVLLKVNDTGVGISKEQQGDIFKRFYQVDASMTRIQDGTGIGLALVKELILLQNGSINLESEIGKGTTFSVIIPIQINENKKVESIRPQAISTSTMPLFIDEFSEDLENNINENKENEKLELLIIEDNYEMRHYIKSCIDETIYNITEAENGEIGIEKAIKLIPDIIISDVMMPKKDGFEVTKTLRKKLETSHIPIILLTAKSSLESRLEGLRRGADAYLTKPFSPKELMFRIQNLIEIRLLIQNKFERKLVGTLAKNGASEENHETTICVQEDEFVKAVRVYINENLEDYQLNGEMLAKHFSMSRMQLHRKLKALTNSSASVFIRNERLENAMKLMETSTMNISEIAYETGFSSPAHFSKTFKKEIGKTPSQYLEDEK